MIAERFDRLPSHIRSPSEALPLPSIATANAYSIAFDRRCDRGVQSPLPLWGREGTIEDGLTIIGDEFFDLLARRMASTSPADRRALIVQADKLFPARRRQGWRDELLRRLARVTGNDADSVRELGRRVDAAIALRSGAKIRSTGSAGIDGLVDRILLCGKVLTDRHVRTIIAKVPLGKDQRRDFPN